MFGNNSKEQQMLGQRVMTALKHLKYNATIGDLCSHIASTNKKSCELIIPDVKRVLNRGIRNGFLIRSAKHYLLPHSYQVDGDDSEWSPKTKAMLAACDKAQKDEQLAKNDRTNVSKAKDSAKELTRIVAINCLSEALDNQARELDNEGALSTLDKVNLEACKLIQEHIDAKRSKRKCESSEDDAESEEESEEEFEEDSEVESEDENEISKSPTCPNRKKKKI